MRCARLLSILAAGLASLAAAPAPALRPTLLPDGSGTIGLPAGWRVTAVNAMVSAEGPQGNVDLGINVPMYTPQYAATLPPVLKPPVVAPFGDPAAEARIMLGANWHVAPDSIQVLERARVAWWSTGPGETMHLLAPSAKQECLLTVLTGDTGFGQFMYYSSGVCAPPDKFQANLVLLLRIWASWHVSDQVYLWRLKQTALSLRTIGRIIARVNRRRQEAFENANEAWDELIRCY